MASDGVKRESWVEPAYPGGPLIKVWVSTPDDDEARRRMHNLSEGERRAWITAHQAELDSMIAHMEHGMVDSIKGEWSDLVLRTVSDWLSPVCRVGMHDDCLSGRCTCDCGHEMRSDMERLVYYVDGERSAGDGE
jgi:hypothetical protein